MVTYAVPDEFEAGSRQELDELRIEFLISIPGSASHLDRGLEVEKHVDFACWMLQGRQFRDHCCVTEKAKMTDLHTAL